MARESLATLSHPVEKIEVHSTGSSKTAPLSFPQ